MTREEARKAAEVMLAYANGEEIETLCFEEYVPCENPAFNWVDGKGIENYRIKSEPKYRPFQSQEECWNEMLKHQPFGWLKGKESQIYKDCCYVFDCGIFGEMFDAAYNYYTFADGTPFGIKEV